MNDAPQASGKPGEPLVQPGVDGPELPAPREDWMITPSPPMVAGDATGGTSRRRGASWLLRSLVGLSLIVGLASLALNGFLLLSLGKVRQTTLDGLDAALNALDSLESTGFRYEYQFRDTLPVAVEIPVQQEMMFPFQGDFAFDTDIQIPIDTGFLGTFVLDVPIDTSIPVDIEVPVQISQTVAISTSIPLSLTVPIDVRANDPALHGFIDGLRQWLLRLRQSFEVSTFLPLQGSG